MAEENTDIELQPIQFRSPVDIYREVVLIDRTTEGEKTFCKIKFDPNYDGIVFIFGEENDT